MTLITEWISSTEGNFRVNRRKKMRKTNPGEGQKISQSNNTLSLQQEYQ
jgi:hypothetical protein